MCGDDSAGMAGLSGVGHGAIWIAEQYVNGQGSGIAGIMKTGQNDWEEKVDGRARLRDD